MKINTQQRKTAVRNIVLVPYKPRPKDWGMWRIKSPYATSTIASPPLDVNNQSQNQNQTSMSLIVLTMNQCLHHHSMKMNEIFVHKCIFINDSMHAVHMHSVKVLDQTHLSSWMRAK